MESSGIALLYFSTSLLLNPEKHNTVVVRTYNFIKSVTLRFS